jgi:hypothetical protein
MREEHLFNKSLLHATSMALVLMVLLGNGLAQWFSKKIHQPWATKTGRLHGGADHERRGQIDQGDGPPPFGPRGDVFHTAPRGQLYRQSEQDELPDDPGEDKDDHDIIGAVQCAHEATVALWLAGSWCCNLGSNGTSAPHSERPVSFLSGRDARSSNQSKRNKHAK